MLAKSRRYPASAELLSRSGDFDSAASRLYYAMYMALKLCFSVEAKPIPAIGQ